MNQRGNPGSKSEKRHAEHMLVRDLQHRYDFRDFETVIWQPGDIALEAKLKAILGYVPTYALNREYGYVIGSGEVKH